VHGRATALCRLAEWDDVGLEARLVERMIGLLDSVGIYLGRRSRDPDVLATLGSGCALADRDDRHLLHRVSARQIVTRRIEDGHRGRGAKDPHLTPWQKGVADVLGTHEPLQNRLDLELAAVEGERRCAGVSEVLRLDLCGEQLRALRRCEPARRQRELRLLRAGVRRTAAQIAGR
jgi:hypothetical protein